MYRYTSKLLLLLLFVMTFSTSVMAQIQVGNDMSDIDYSLPRDYEIAGITVTGVKHLDPQVLVMISGLQVGETIKVPGDKITDAIRKLWEQGLFEDINISAAIRGDADNVNIPGKLVDAIKKLQKKDRTNSVYYKDKDGYHEITSVEPCIVGEGKTIVLIMNGDE